MPSHCTQRLTFTSKLLTPIARAELQKVFLPCLKKVTDTVDWKILPSEFSCATPIDFTTVQVAAWEPQQTKEHETVTTYLRSIMYVVLLLITQSS